MNKGAIRWSLPLDPRGRGDREPIPIWPMNWPLPEVGHSVTLINNKCLKVTAVDWFPHGELGDPEPFVYIVLREHQITARNPKS